MGQWDVTWGRERKERKRAREMATCIVIEGGTRGSTCAKQQMGSPPTHPIHTKKPITILLHTNGLLFFFFCCEEM